MEITQHNSDKLVIEQRNLLLQGILAALFIAGISLIVGTAKHFGIQSTYRFTYWMGGLLSLLSLGGLSFMIKSSKVILDKKSNTFSLVYRRGWSKKSILKTPLSEIKSVRIDQKGNPPKFRLSVQDPKEQWYALQQNNIRDLAKLEKLGKYIQAFLEGARA